MPYGDKDSILPLLKKEALTNGFKIKINDKFVNLE
jgi:hypothetical protein